VPRAGLSRTAVTEIAVRIVDDSGIDGMSLAAVAAEAGVAVPSLYKHIGSLADLRRAVAVVALRELTRRAAAATVGRSGEDALRALGHAIRAFATERPGLYAATQVAPHADDAGDSEQLAAAADAVEIVAAVLRGFGLPEAMLVPAVRTVRSAVHGFVDLSAHAGFGLPDDLDRSFDTLLDVLVAGLRDVA
jgi:AcrR family transcriptional regulator